MHVHVYACCGHVKIPEREHRFASTRGEFASDSTHRPRHAKRLALSSVLHRNDRRAQFGYGELDLFALITFNCAICQQACDYVLKFGCSANPSSTERRFHALLHAPTYVDLPRHPGKGREASCLVREMMRSLCHTVGDSPLSRRAFAASVIRCVCNPIPRAESAEGSAACSATASPAASLSPLEPLSSVPTCLCWPSAVAGTPAWPARAAPVGTAVSLSLPSPNVCTGKIPWSGSELGTESGGAVFASNIKRPPWPPLNNSSYSEIPAKPHAAELRPAIAKRCGFVHPLSPIGIGARNTTCRIAYSPQVS